MPLLPPIFSSNPTIFAAQVVLLVLGSLLVFFVFFTLRDIVLRTESFWLRVACVLLVGLVPIAGFLLYLLIRPSTTIRERQLEGLLLSLMDASGEGEDDSGEEIAEETHVPERTTEAEKTDPEADATP